MHECVWAKLLQLCPTPRDSMDCSLPGSCVHGNLQARILEWVAIPFCRGSSPPRDQIRVSHIAGRFFTIWSTRKAPTWVMSPTLGKLLSVMREKFLFNKMYQAFAIPNLARIPFLWGHSFVHYFWKWRWAVRVDEKYPFYIYENMWAPQLQKAQL